MKQFLQIIVTIKKAHLGYHYDVPNTWYHWDVPNAFLIAKIVGFINLFLVSI